MLRLEFKTSNVENCSKSLIRAWVKNVNKLRVERGTNSVVLSPTRPNTTTTRPSTNGKLGVIRTSVRMFPQLLSTPKSIIFNLLNVVYTHYPQRLLLEPIKKI